MTQFSYLVIILVACLSVNSNFLGNKSDKSSLRYLITPTPANALMLGSAANYAVLAGSTTTNSGITKVTGSVGISPGNVFAGDAIEITSGEFHAGDSKSQTAQIDLTSAYDKLFNTPGATDMTGTELGGLTIANGVYKFTSSCFLSAGILTLDANGDANATWIFQIVTTFIAGVNTKIVMINSGSPLNVYWQVGSSATFKDSSIIKGNIVAYSSIAFGNLVNLEGRALARLGGVTMLSNTIVASDSSNNVLNTSNSVTTNATNTVPVSSTSSTGTSATTTGTTATTTGTTSTSSNSSYNSFKWLTIFVLLSVLMI